VAPDWISLRITDDGSGMSVDDRRKSSSFGIAGMNERLRAQGGTLRIDSTPGAGTTLEALVPLRGRSAQNGAPSDRLDADDDRATRPAAGVRSCDG
jgi:signal transduction histidine kinase